MGEHSLSITNNEQDRLVYINHLLDDLKSLDYMLEHGMIEDNIVRMGAEQEFCLVDEHWRPATNSTEILKEIDDEHFTTELARFNLEINLDPMEIKGDVFGRMEQHLDELLAKAHKVSDKHKSKVVLTGILPSISHHEMGIEYMTPVPRYYALNDIMSANRGSDFRMQFTGTDEFAIAHNSVMFEACNTSFQLHLQLDPEQFASDYNWAQAISGPVLAACVNSPLLFGRELWSETRISLFQQSIDMRKSSRALIDQQARVSFGEDWVKGSIADYYRNEISRYPILLTKEIEKNSFEEVLKGNAPKLAALGLFNGTVYRWNRPCYGVGNGKAHIRIENRYIPSGPTVVDEIANFAFWIGLMKGRPTHFDTIHETMDFQDVKGNFIRAAQHGSESVMNWMERKIPVVDLILNELLPMAKDGLGKMKIDPSAIERYLGIIEKRLHTKTGAQWIVKNYRNLKEDHRIDDALLRLTEGIYRNQVAGKAVCDWQDLQTDIHPISKASKVGHLMSSKLVKANQSDSARLVLEFMGWNNIHHLPVVDDQDNLVGLVTWSHLEKYGEVSRDIDKMLCAKDIMVKNVITTSTSTSLQDALLLAREHLIGCLPVVEDGTLVGILTSKDLMKISNA